MERLTTNKSASEMSMLELAYNACYVGEDKWVRYRDYEEDIDIRELARRLLKIHADGDDAFTDDYDFGDYITSCLECGLEDIEGLIAVFYRNLWAMGNLRERLKEYEDLEEQGKLLNLPCAVGDTVYRFHKGTKLSPNRTYECKVVGVKREYNTFSVKLHANINEETYSIWIDNWFDRCQIGHEFFLTIEEAEAALNELKKGEKGD